ncbi:hypothetical protein BCF44_11912 [Kutzneria buriramensis]|uniref:Galactose oxidase-like protein n=2 Tax=Kutzneria buriramensis TaxID=1045776 RepID=A0A3E0GYI7_9PSEU|nr:hypothetical protein BCF44_11912 [Kutzneria buriramensis]
MAAAAVLVTGTSAEAAAGLQPVPSPNVAGSDFNQLDGVSTTTSGDAWTVGFTRPAGTLTFHALAEHLVGGKWAIVPTAPVPAVDDTRLHAIAFRAATDGWAVGEDTNAAGPANIAQSMIEHWNGISWARVPSPGGEPANTRLTALAIVSATDVWAVGGSTIEHWNGVSWTVTLSALPVARLLGIAAVAANDVWVVGSNGARHPTPVIQHWDGTSWSQVPQPVTGFDSVLHSVSAVSSTDVWAVGEQNLNQTVTEHWDGKSWTLVPSPSISANSAQDTLDGVIALGRDDVWAVGQTLQGFTTDQTLALHWDGTGWQIVPSANPGPGSNALNAVAGAGAGQPLWAAGFATGGTPQFATLIETTTG